MVEFRAPLNEQNRFNFGLSPVPLSGGFGPITACFSTKNLYFLRKYATIFYMETQSFVP